MYRLILYLFQCAQLLILKLWSALSSKALMPSHGSAAPAFLDDSCEPTRPFMFHPYIPERLSDRLTIQEHLRKTLLSLPKAHGSSHGSCTCRVQLRCAMWRLLLLWLWWPKSGRSAEQECLDIQEMVSL
jgi:hypothetical protein